MHWIDWCVVAAFCLVSLGLGAWYSRRASEGLESYFVSNRMLGWWLAGTSMAATTFSSDTPLLVTGMVRRRGVWGAWEIWALAISTMLAVFVFARLWKRAGVVTEVEFVELRYTGKSAAFLRGFKALYWGIFYNVFIMGSWPIMGLTKVLEVTTSWNKVGSICFALGLTAIYSSLSGYWGVVLTDVFQFIWAMVGAFILAAYAVHAVGGLHNLVTQLAATDKLSILPPAAGENIAASPFGWFLGLIFIQWWAWKNTDGGGIIVQRMVSCRDEKQAVLSTLWFNIAHYALRSWPWVITALASLILIPELKDAERAYPVLITQLLPIGMRGVLVASFLAAFMSTIDTHLNWGSSYFVNDFYKRFVKKDASEHHYLSVARTVPVVLAAAAGVVAFYMNSLGAVFTLVLNFSAGIGPVYLLRWFWWRINPASEITAMIASLPVLMMRHTVLKVAGLDGIFAAELLFMILGTAAFWLPATLLTQPVDHKHLAEFYSRTRPPGFWKPFLKKGGGIKDNWTPYLVQWLVGTVALLATTLGPIELLLLRWTEGLVLCGIALVGWIYLIKQKWE